MIKSLNKLLLLIVVVIFFGCSGKGDIKLCEGVWQECSSGEECDCWKN